MCVFIVFLFHFALATVYASSVIFEDCGSAYQLRSVNIEGCGFALPCYITLGDDVPVSLEFYAGSAYQLRSVNIEGCGFALPCYITLGDDVPVSLEFYAGFVSRNLDQNVVLNINHLNLRTPVTPERCEIDNCPVQTGAVTTLISVMSVPSSIALNQRGYLRWRIINEAGRQVLCYSVLVQTQSQLQKLLREYEASLQHKNRYATK